MKEKKRREMKREGEKKRTKSNVHHNSSSAVWFECSRGCQWGG